MRYLGPYRRLACLGLVALVVGVLDELTPMCWTNGNGLVRRLSRVPRPSSLQEFVSLFSHIEQEVDGRIDVDAEVC